MKDSNDRDSASDVLGGALADLESAAAQALVPGELCSWSERLAGRLDEVRDAVVATAADREALLAQILDEDLELAARVKTLKESLEELLRGLERLRARARNVVAHDTPSSSEEAREEGRALRMDALAWVVEMRALEGALGTWLQEAVRRDRGVRD